MKYRWLEKIKKEEVEELTGQKVKSIITGDLDIGNSETARGIEIEFEEELISEQLVPLDEKLSEFKREPPPEPTPPLSTHPARLDAINPSAVKPATITRLFLTETGFTTLWNGKEYSYDCYVTQSVVDEWQAGKIVPGDFVFIEFLEGDVTKPIVTLKIYRTW